MPCREIDSPSERRREASYNQFGGIFDMVEAKSVDIDSFGNFYMAGERLDQAFPTTPNAWLDSCDAASYCGRVFIIKANSLGVKQWARAYGPSTASGPSTQSSVLVTDLSVAGDDSLVAVGWANNQDPAGWTGITGHVVLWVMKLDSSGAATWTHFFSSGLSSSKEYAWALTHDASNNIYVAGQTNGDFGGTSQGSTDCFLMKLSASGTQTWLVQYGGTGADVCYSVALAPGSGDIVTAGDKGGNLFASFRQSSDGAEVWSYDSDSVLGYPDHPRVAVDSSNNVLLAGGTNAASFGGFTRSGDPNVFLVKLNSAGAHQWTQLLSDDYSYLNSVRYTSSGSLVALVQDEAATAQVLISFDSSGTAMGYFRDDPAAASALTPWEFVFDSNGDIWVTGSITNGNWPGVSKLGTRDAYLNKVLGFMVHLKMTIFFSLLKNSTCAFRQTVGPKVLKVRCCGH